MYKVSEYGVVVEYFVSPRYDHFKLENPSLLDLIDVFEDSWLGYVFEPARLLLDNGDDVAAMTLVTSYFEAINIYTIGESSAGKSRQYFVNGFSKCFNASTGGVEKCPIKTSIRTLQAHVYYAGLKFTPKSRQFSILDH